MTEPFRDESPDFVFCDDGGRPLVKPYAKTSRFRVNDQVNLIVHDANGTETYEGPYKIESVPAAGKYILCLPNGQSAKDGIEVEEKDLKGVSLQT